MLSLGSMQHLAPERARDLLLASVRRAQVRAIIQCKAHDEEGQDGDVYFLPWAPHRWLAPLCSAFVHHGGAGTTHAALRAGLVSVVLPFIFEQRLWAKRLGQVGALGGCTSFWRARPDQVARYIRRAISSEPPRRRAGELARAMASEDGAATAADRLERLLA